MFMSLVVTVTLDPVDLPEPLERLEPDDLTDLAGIVVGTVRRMLEGGILKKGKEGMSRGGY